MPNSDNSLTNNLRKVLSRRFFDGYTMLGGKFPIRVPNQPLPKNQTDGYIRLSLLQGEGNTTFYQKRTRNPIILTASVYVEALKGTAGAFREADIIADVWRDQTYKILDNRDRVVNNVLAFPRDGQTFQNQIVTASVRLGDPGPALDLGRRTEGDPWYQVNVQVEGYLEAKFGNLTPLDALPEDIPDGALKLETDGAILDEQGNKILFG